jgi:uncharacterized protein (TIGR02598 family)
MHTPAPPDTQTAPAVHLPQPTFRGRPRAGFSLIEVTLAIAIIAFAFVALIGLLPAGLGVFNQTMDASNAMRISSDLTSMLQATEFENLTAAKIVGNIYYFDVDGGLLDSDLAPNPRYQNERIYAARIIIDNQSVNQTDFKPINTRKALVVVGRNNPDVVAKLGTLNTAVAVQGLEVKLKLKVIPLVITKTDGVI